MAKSKCENKKNSVDEKPTDSEPVDKKTTDCKSVNEKPTETKLVDQKATKCKSGDKKTTESKSVDEKPSASKSADAKPTGSKSVDEKPTGSKSVNEKTTETQSPKVFETVNKCDKEGGSAETKPQVGVIYRDFAEEPLKLRVHDVKIQGNTRTKDVVIEAQLENVRKAENSQSLLREVAFAVNRIENLGIFEECIVSLEPGPVELPGTANVIVKVKEPKYCLGADVGIYNKPGNHSCTFDGSLKVKNILGYAETWDGTISYGYDGTTDMGAGIYYPRFRNRPVDLVARASIFSQDWKKQSSYTEQLIGISTGFITKKNHELNYNLSWRTLQDPSRMASGSIKRQLGHSLLSAIKYIYKIDNRNSRIRPTKGYAFRAASEVAGLLPDNRLVRYIRQELDFRCAVPLGILNAALNMGISGGLIVPWGPFSGRTTLISDRFFMGGNASLVCDMNGPINMPGFHCRGIGPFDWRRTRSSGSDDAELRDNIGGDISLTAFADISFDLPIEFLRKQNIHGHCFVSAGNLMGLSDVKGMSLEKFQSTIRVSAGTGIVIPTKFFRLEVNYCEVLRQLDSDTDRRGIQFSFSSAR